MQKLGERIRHVRGRMSQEAFAGLLGISKGALGGYERGENCPNADVILIICKKCRINVSWLMSGTGAMQAPEDIAAGGPQEGGPGEPAGERSPADEKTACRVVPGQNEKMENDALRAHCRWLQERLDQLEAERRDLNRENRQLWQKNAALASALRGWSSHRSSRGGMPAPRAMTAWLPWRSPATAGAAPVCRKTARRRGTRAGPAGAGASRGPAWTPLPAPGEHRTCHAWTPGIRRRPEDAGAGPSRRAGPAFPVVDAPARAGLRARGGRSLRCPAGVSPLLLTGQADIVLCPGKT